MIHNVLEEWRPVAGYEGFYEVSNLGRVRSLDRVVNNNGGADVRPGRVLKPHSNKYRRGELSVALCKEGRPLQQKIHRLVAFAFPEICGEWFEGAEVDHINGDPMDDRAENLRFVDHLTNVNNPMTKGKYTMTEEHRETIRNRMRENNPAFHYTEEWRQKIGEASKGRKHSEDSKRKMSEATMGRYLGGKSPRAISIKRFNEVTEVIYDAYRTAERETGISRSVIRGKINDGKKDKEGYKWALCS